MCYRVFLVLFVRVLLRYHDNEPLTKNERMPKSGAGRGVNHMPPYRELTVLIKNTSLEGFVAQLLSCILSSLW